MYSWNMFFSKSGSNKSKTIEALVPMVDLFAVLAIVFMIYSSDEIVASQERSQETIDKITKEYQTLQDEMQTAEHQREERRRQLTARATKSLAEIMYTAAVDAAGWNDPSKPVAGGGRGLAMGLVMAQELGDQITEVRLRDAVESRCEPRFFGADDDEFGWYFGLGEDWPRGQLSAYTMLAEIGSEGSWWRIFNRPNLGKFDEPTIEGVDFPRIALSEARWDGKALHVAAHPQNAGIAGSRTTVRLTNITGTDGWSLTRTGGKKVRLAGNGDHIKLELTADNQTAVISRD